MSTLVILGASCAQIIDYAATYHGDQEVISRTVEGPTVVSTYRQVRDRAALCSLALRRLGVQPGDRVATLAWNTVRHLECWYGIAGVGAVCHTLNPRLFDKELEYIINHAEDTIIMTDITFADILRRLGPSLPRCVKAIIFLTNDAHMPKSPVVSSVPTLCYEDLLEEEVKGLSDFRWAECAENAACGLCYTSGTTGNPKGVLYSHRSNFLHATITCLPDALDLKSASTVLMVVPMFHANSWGIAFGAPLVGARLVLPGPALDGGSIYDLLESCKVTHTAGVPTVWLGLMDHMERCRIGLSSLKIMIVGGAACPRRIIEFFEDKHRVEVRQLWGMTELSPCGTIGAIKGTLAGKITREEEIKLKLKQGRPHIFMEMRIVDDSGNELPHDGIAFGNLQVRGPAAIRTYFRSEATGANDEGWFDTGDVATMDKEGHMQITDRSKDVIKSGGEWISSIEIENIAVGHPGVTEAAVIGIYDEKWSERPLLIVVRNENGPSVTKNDLLGYLEGKIARWWIPDDVVFVESIPHTATGKISKLLLRQQFKDYKIQRSRL